MMKHLSLKAKFAVYEFLKDKIVQDGEYFRYSGNWSDQEVCRKFNTTAAVIRGIRQDFFGPMRAGTQNSGIPGAPQLRADVDSIMEYLTRKDPNWRDLN